MKKKLSNLWVPLFILASFALLSACATLAGKPPAKPVPTTVKKVDGILYKHKSPAFSIIYPKTWREGKPDGSFV